MCEIDQKRHTQALAYLAYRADGQNVPMSKLAGDILVPKERLSKDVKAIEARLGLCGFIVADTDADAFASVLPTMIMSHSLCDGVRVVDVTRWCRSIFDRAAASGNAEFLNAAPRNQAMAALVLYCERVGTPFTEEYMNAYVGSKRKRCDGNTTAAMISAMSKTKSIRSAVRVLREVAAE
jgi:hypothetical protein